MEGVINMRRIKIRSGRCLGAICACVLASGCAYPAVYGASWAEQVKVESDACPVIDGVYQNTGEEFIKDKNDGYERRSRSLAHLLNGGSYSEWHESAERLGRTAFDPAGEPYQTLSLRVAEGKLHVEASRADGSSRAFDLPTRQQCRDSTLLLEKGWGNSGTMVYLSLVERATLALGQAEDGSLLVRYSTSGAGFFMYLPVMVATEAFWIKFPPVAPAPASTRALAPVQWQEEKPREDRSGSGIPVRLAGKRWLHPQ